jgi:hypothetical protein
MQQLYTACRPMIGRHNIYLIHIKPQR